MGQLFTLQQQQQQQQQQQPLRKTKATLSSENQSLQVKEATISSEILLQCLRISRRLQNQFGRLSKVEGRAAG